MIIQKNFFTDMPIEIGNLMKLEKLTANDNLFEGKYPHNRLQTLFLDFIPCQLLTLVSMIFSSLHTGQIPDEITYLWRLEELNLQNNCEFCCC